MPNTREKLIELLRSAYGTSFNAPYLSEHELEPLASHLIANGVTVQEWIPVTERLPENKGNYLGFTGSTTMVGYYKGDGVWWIWLNDREGENLFTHWMPLPEPPKEV